MGNQQTRESRAPGSAESQGTPSGTPVQNRLSRHTSSSTNANPARPDRRNRLSRADVFGAFINNSAAGAGAHGRDSSSGPSGRLNEGAEEEPFQRKETRQERDARRREKHAALRMAERERSLRSEGVDGGYLVTLGTYTGPEDFSKPAVRQLQIERRLAPFWKGLENHDEGWTDYQLAAAVRGLPVPEADEQPPEGFFAPPSAHQDATNLAVPGAGASDHLQPGQPSVPALRASSPFRPRGARALAVALNLGGQRGLSSEASAAAPREITLPQDTNVDGRPIESALYCDAMECPICFLTYPPYLNYTRCCSQPICSECFVQIKRPDPHLPEHHPGEDASPANVPDEEREEELISEPSTCPYCQQSELGVTYEPPPFRRGLVYSSPLGDALLSPAASQAMSSQSSFNSPPNPASPTSPGTRRRTHSLSANAPNVVTTDRIRPDWETKLMTARQNRARRAAAATALHTAAFMTNQPTSWGRLSIFRHAVSPGSSSAARQPSTHAEEGGASSNDNNSDPAAQAFSRLEEFENFLVAEGIRQSLASKESEDRKEAKRREKEERKAREKTEKEERKAREQREKEERKTLKQQQKSVYGGGAGSAASRSSLSIPFGRKRGNSTASLTKGNSPAQSALPTPGEVDEEESQPQGHSQSVDKGKAPERPVSRLRHFSTASSMQSRQQESLPGSADGAESASPASQGHGGPAQSSAGARASALSLDSAADSDGAPAGAETTDPLFNYHSMAKGMGMDIDTGCIEDTPATVVSEAAQAQETRQEEGDVDVSVATLRPEGTLEVSQSDTQVDSQPQVQTKLEAPQLVVTPDTPADGPGETGDKFSMGPTSHIAESQEVAR